MQDKLEDMLANITMTECDMHSGGFVLYWGASESKHIRVWCFSSLLLNEPSPIMLRSRVPEAMDLVFRSSLGILTGEAQLSIDSLQLQLEVSSFGVMNRTKRDSADKQDGGGRSSGGGIVKSVAEALMEAGAGGIVGAVLMGVLLLAIIGGLAAWMWSRADDDDDSEYSDYSSSEESEGDDAQDAERGSPEGDAKEPAGDSAEDGAKGATAEKAETAADTGT
ncbi:hypothetical protein FJT64_015607 [Amphibalanus amphitrite]|uniref:Uncharacterized protein n=1 Tax=Amphibalanus amphitrite TaxID=1232801 RepID=A0A6A4XGE1_AMPAM|nr:hypothetical protein FJT64_015607 [Amphibalanus amphitrite]